MDRVDRDDIRVLEPGQCPGLAGQVGRDLERDEPVGELALTGEVYPAKCASAQYCNQLKSGKPLPNDGELIDRVLQPIRSGRGGFAARVRWDGLADSIADCWDFFREARFESERDGANLQGTHEGTGRLRGSAFPRVRLALPNQAAKHRSLNLTTGCGA